jgi:hypothetical protein
MIHQAVESRSPVKTTARLILLAASTLWLGTANAQSPFESQVPPQIRKGCIARAKMNYLQFHNPVLARGEYTFCINAYFLALRGIPAPSQGLPAPSQSSPGSEVSKCYARCDEAERSCNKIARFYSTPGGSQECSADRRSCDARCR